MNSLFSMARPWGQKFHAPNVFGEQKVIWWLLLSTAGYEICVHHGLSIHVVQVVAIYYRTCFAMEEKVICMCVLFLFPRKRFSCKQQFFQDGIP